MGATRGLLVLHNGQIHTFDARHPRTHAIALRNGSVVALDDAAMALAQQAEAVRDLQGACVIPGFNDTHAHMEREGLKTLRAYFGARDQRFRGNVITCFGGKLIAGFGGT